MSRKRGPLAGILIGVTCLVAGIVLGISSVFPLMSQFDPIIQVRSPEPAELLIEEAGIFTLWHDHRAIVDGKTVSNDPTLPSGFSFVLTPAGGGGAIPLDPIRTNSTLSLGSRESVGIGTFEVATPGTYALEITNPDRDVRIFSLTRGNLLQGMAQFGLRLVLALIVGGGGLVLLVIGIVFMVRASRPAAARPAGSSPPPPPIPG